MKKENTLKELLYSLQPYPNMRFLLFTDRLGGLEREIFDYCKKNEHEVQLYDMSSQGLDIQNNIKIRPFKATQPRYNLHGRLYDYCFIHKKPKNLDEFLERIYKAIANAGRLYIIMDIDKKEQILALASLLEEKNFVSISKIELDDNTLYLSAKKMHGWGS